MPLDRTKTKSRGSIWPGKTVSKSPTNSTSFEPKLSLKVDISTKKVALSDDGVSVMALSSSARNAVSSPVLPRATIASATPSGASSIMRCSELPSLTWPTKMMVPSGLYLA